MWEFFHQQNYELPMIFFVSHVQQLHVSGLHRKDTEKIVAVECSFIIKHLLPALLTYCNLNSWRCSLPFVSFCGIQAWPIPPRRMPRHRQHRCSYMSGRLSGSLPVSWLQGWKQKPWPPMETMEFQTHGMNSDEPWKPEPLLTYRSYRKFSDVFS